MLIAGSYRVLGPKYVVAAPALNRRHFDDDLTVEVEQVLHSHRPTVGVVRGGVERRVARQAVGLEVDAGVPQHATGIGPARQQLRAFEAGEEVEVGNEVQRVEGRDVESEVPPRNERIL